MIELAIVGAGVMGANHARTAMGLRDAVVTTVVDTDEGRAEALANSIGCKYTTSYDDLQVDGAVLAIPTPLHHPLGIELLKRRIPLLMEKPIASTLKQATELVEVAEEYGTTLMIGHVERFNPAVLALDSLLQSPLHIEAARISPFSPRVQSGVVLDLMIHDIDIVMAVARSPLVNIEAVGRCINSGAEDIANAFLVFEDGLTAVITASRVGQNKIRRFSITEKDSYITLDLIRQDVTINRVSHGEFMAKDGVRYRQTGMVEIPYLEHRGEPLFLELEHFVECVTNRTAPRTSGRSALESLRIALTVAELARSKPTRRLHN